VSFLLVAAIAQPSQNQAPDRTWITDVPIISPEKLDRIEKGSVLVENGRIVRVERKTGAKKPASATVVYGEGQFLIPGLIDSHVHVASIPGIGAEVNSGPAEAKPTWIKEYFKQLPRSYLYFGYTMLVDLAVVDRRVLEDFRQAPLVCDFSSREVISSVYWGQLIAEVFGRGC
jgi:formylmethanofuran dehydrogenase subunit A